MALPFSNNMAARNRTSCSEMNTGPKVLKHKMTNMCCYISGKGNGFNPLSTKLYLSDLKTHFVPRNKHSLLQF